MSSPLPPVPVIRPASPADLPAIVLLTAEHAAYEKADRPAADLADRLNSALFGAPTPRLHCLVVELPDGELVGYATCAPEFATWQGREYLHLDCLYLRDLYRGLGMGTDLFAAVLAHATSLGVTEVQWNTPAWNTGAIRFYDRFGAVGKDKVRYTLQTR